MSLLAPDTPLIFDIGQDGRANCYLPSAPALDTFLPKALLRDELPLPDNSELDVNRHFTLLSHKTFGIDTNFYPLGSCTMKYNPRINDAMANYQRCAICTPSRLTNSRRARSRLCGNSSAVSRRSSAWPRFHSIPPPVRTPNSRRCSLQRHTLRRRAIARARRLSFPIPRTERIPRP